MKTVLHAGCGAHAAIPEWFAGFSEVRLDIDPACKPDIVANMADLPEGLGKFDALYTSHTLEHLNPQDVIPCLMGFLRVLKPGAPLIIIVPDLTNVRPTEDVVYWAPIGRLDAKPGDPPIGAMPVTGLDMYYGHNMFSCDNPYMAHKCGFVTETLRRALTEAGFKNVRVFPGDGGYHWNLFGVANAP